MLGPEITTVLPDEEPNKNTQPRRWTPLHLHFRHINAFAIALSLAAAGLVSVAEMVFVLLSLIYMYFLSKFAFPSLGPSTAPPVYCETNRLLGIYVLVGATVGLFLPAVYILGGIYEGDGESTRAAAPHLFLLASQVLMEGLSFNSDSFSIPIRVYVPVLYNSRRIFAIVDWLSFEISETNGSQWRAFAGRALAVANMAFWSFNLFGFLLPVYLPKAFKIYYSNMYKTTKDD